MYPNLISIGPLTLHTYGLFLALAFILASRVAVYYARREKMDAGSVMDLMIYIFVAALVGAKLLHLVVDWSYYSEDWHRLAGIYQVGGVYYGGLILAILVSIWFVRRRAMKFWKTADVLSMGLAFGQIFGRLGCFFAGCCWGKEVSPDFPLGVTFTNTFAAEQVGTPLNIPLHPAQLYESIGMILVFLIMVYFFPRRKFYGQQLFLYLLLYSMLRFSVEFFRGDPRGSVFHGMLSTSQFVSIFAFLSAICILVARREVPPGVPRVA